nr:DUF397 domain-containing protein [Glycomyces tenuis]
MAEFTGWRKSSRSANGSSADCVECRQSWRKSSRSDNASSANCVEARHLTAGFQVRDSKLGHKSPVFDLSTSDFAALLKTVSLTRTATRRAAVVHRKSPGFQHAPPIGSSSVTRS